MSDIVNDALRAAPCKDRAELAAVRVRPCERALGVEAFLAKLKADGAP